MAGGRASRIFASFVCAVAMLWLAEGIVGCRQTNRWGSPELNAEVARLEAANECEKAIAVVRVANARQDPDWYVWMIRLKLRCFAKTRESHYGDEASRLVDEGIRKFPKSPRFVFLKGWINERMGERGIARTYFEEALKMARADLAADAAGPHSAEDRDVARDAAASLAADGKPSP